MALGNESIDRVLTEDDEARRVERPSSWSTERFFCAGFRLLWRPPIPKTLRELIRRMTRDNPHWGQERIANELLLKLGFKFRRAR